MTTQEPADARVEDFERAYSQLCHLLGLTQSGKLEAALDDLVLTTLVVDPALGATDESALSKAIFDYFGLKPPRDEVLRAMRRLEERSALVRDQAGHLAASPQVAHSVESR